jgi:recombination protein RecA
MGQNEGTARLSVATKAIEKEYGHIIKWLGEAASQDRETISTGCLGLDNAIGNGGLERGLVAEFFGGAGAGKSFLSYSVIKSACDRGYKCAIVDAETSADAKLLVKVGLPADQVIVVDGASTGEANLEIADMLMQTGEFAVVVIDSVAALVPKARTEDAYDQQTMGLHARLMSAGLQKILPVAKVSNTLLIFINQIRNKIGSYGNPQTTTGGESLPFYASYRIEVIGSPQQKSRRLVLDGTGEVYGHRTTFRVVKNRRAAPYREAEVDLIYGLGYDIDGEILDLAVDVGLIEKGGAWLTFGENKWQGRDKAKIALQKSPKLQETLTKQVRDIISGDSSADPGPPEGPENDVISDDGEVVDDKPVSKKRARKSQSSAT